MRNDLEKTVLNWQGECMNLRSEVHELRAVVDPLKAILKAADECHIVAAVPTRIMVRRYAPLTDAVGATLPEALSALLAALKPPEPKWTVETWGHADFKAENESAACAKAAELTSMKPMNFTPMACVKRDDTAVCVYIGGERFNKVPS